MEFSGDTLAAMLPEGLRQEERLLFIVQKFSDDVLQVRLLTDARPLNDKGEGSPCWVSGKRKLKFFTTAQVRKVELTPFGKVRHKHRKLWYGTQKKMS